ncbi:ABC transporter permease subunit [Melissospora conviva]|uniref:ABC transporter permease subunit n=1 Tax=Melissospora conviva TaxID=3388432 RepID=UPI003C14DAA2
MSFFNTELRRLFKRRLTRVTLALVALLLGGMAASTAFTSHQSTPEGRAAAEAAAQPQYQQAVRDHERSIADCEAAEARGENTEMNYGPDCGREWGPQLEWYVQQPYEFDFAGEFGGRLMGLGLLLVLAAVLIGASFVGAEWTSGGMMNLLLWQPGRLKVLLTKLAALVTGLFGVSVLLGVCWTVAYWLIGTYRGTMGEMTAGAWTSTGLTGLRTVGLILAAAVVAFGLASLGRHTALALGGLVGIFVINEVAVLPLLRVLGTSFPDRFTFTAHLMAWFERELPLFDYVNCTMVQGECVPAEMVLTWQDSGLVFAIGTLLVLGAALWAMRRRDIA